VSRAGRSCLIVSNGHGEDAVGALLARRLAGAGFQVVAFPLAGTGDAYGTQTPLLDPRRAFPSGGFGLRGAWRALPADLRAGLLRHWTAQRTTLAAQRDRYDLAVAIGDVYCLWMAAHARRPAVFIATAKSARNEPHRWLERLLIRRLARAVYTRDEVTARALGRSGLPARYAGNPLMDTLAVTGAPLPVAPHLPTVTLLPGSRADALRNLLPLLRLGQRLRARRPVVLLLALAPGVHIAAVAQAARPQGWEVTERGLQQDGVEVVITRAFGDAVAAADVVVGLAGTANEQAAGLGKPVVAFPGPGAQYTRRFMRLQQRLLGEALVGTASWQAAAEAVARLLDDPGERSRRGQAGRERMGAPGAVEAIARELLSAPAPAAANVTT